MKWIVSLIFALSIQSYAQSWADDLGYGKKMIPLDAEDLAEMGIKSNVIKMTKEHPKLLPEVIDVKENIGEQSSTYEVVYKDVVYKIFDANSHSASKVSDSWTAATAAFFKIINMNIKNKNVKFYAIMGGNDLHGAFLTNAEYKKIKKVSMSDEMPYLP